METKRKRKISVKSDEDEEITSKLPKTNSKSIDKKLGELKLLTDLIIIRFLSIIPIFWIILHQNSVLIDLSESNLFVSWN